MRLVKKNYDDLPSILIEKSTLDLLDKICLSLDLSQIFSYIYKGEYKDKKGRLQSHVRDKLNIYYYYKCAYCEGFCKAEIEHYRPKKGVVGLTGHKGYYWLCYEWSNLIPSCRYCNTEGGKGNQFPIAGMRVNLPSFNLDFTINKAQSYASSSPLIDEKPYLLHPEIDNPSDYLGVKLDSQGEGIILTGIDGSNQRGDQTIQICNLNRKELKLKRLRVVDEFIKCINLQFIAVKDGLLPPKNLSKALVHCFKFMENDKENMKLEFSFIRYFIMETPQNFNLIILPCLEQGQRKFVQKVFLQYYQYRTAKSLYK